MPGWSRDGQTMTAYEKQTMQHLERSNRELKEELEKEDDADFREAIEDNIKVLKTKGDRLLKIEEKIRELSPPLEIPPGQVPLAQEGGYAIPAGQLPAQGQDNGAIPAGLDL
ncbi:unnamed protein product [Symbiodinium sp. CCMP2592]|nr:unnamed protein product [Symbiodinium sp. CCMP2592]